MQASQMNLAETMKQTHVNMDAKIDAILKACIAENLESHMKEMQESQMNFSETIKQTHVNMDAKIDAILKAFIAEKVEALTKDKNSNEEKVIAIAKWVSANISNRQNVADKFSDWTSTDMFKGNHFISPVYMYFATRTGLCGARSMIFTEMLKNINIVSKRYNICCFPTKEDAHSCVQVYYDKSWHFFDVTYAGYFKKHGKILSFEEIIEAVKNTEDHLKYLVVFPNGYDHYYGDNIMEQKVDNQERMRRVYSKKVLEKTTDYGYIK